ncbi:MAG: tetratricopeptide repeat protein [Candidatus Methylomirabilales bacterium]
MANWRPLIIYGFIFGSVFATLLLFPGYSDTIRRFIGLPALSNIEVAKVETAEEWAKEVLRTGHNLVYYVWVVGAVAVALLAAVTFNFFNWLAQHKHILESLKLWQRTLARSEEVVLRAVEMLPVGVFSNFNDPIVSQQFRQSVEDMGRVFSPEEIDIQMASISLLTSVPSDVFLRIGNYFRYRASLAKFQGRDEEFKRYARYAIRRYQRARDFAQDESGRKRRLTIGHAAHGIAICLVNLRLEGEALEFTKEAVDNLRADSAAVVPPLTTYALALKRRGQFKEATAMLEEAIGMATFDVVANYNLACCYARCGNTETDTLVRNEHYRKAIAAIERITGRLGSLKEHICGIVDGDEDFNGLRNYSPLRHSFENAITALKAT